MGIDPEVRQRLIDKHASTDAGWEKILASFVQPLAMVLSYRTVFLHALGGERPEDPDPDHTWSHEVESSATLKDTSWESFTAVRERLASDLRDGVWGLVMAEIPEPGRAAMGGLGSLEEVPGAVVLDASLYTELRELFPKSIERVAQRETIKTGLLGLFRKRLALTRPGMAPGRLILVDRAPGTWMRLGTPVMTRDRLTLTAKLEFEFSIEPGSVRHYEVNPA